eukprot:CAMPEP_0185027480 /NCGR_PEP_ID=MMETSP1103-20130426/12565_1 /TAXON_ID=36769 /ORGANISM="Paraphysomonas bandaiensis, Strain Caron Lab Isolate" /LENGTH=965 /DNA_ID=CAMNT_0027561495 /DNA_START=178 /DNA_END=3072 /DNA_ORIENTATION=+
MEEGRDLLRKISSLDKELRSAESVDEKSRIQSHMKQCYVRVIVNYPSIAYSKNVDNTLWKHCFYRKIEDYRKRIRGITSLIDNGTEEGIRIEEQKQNLLRLSTSFNRFLCESALFYENLLVKLERTIYTLLDSKNDSVESSNECSSDVAITSDGNIPALVRSVNFCLVFLGDIARYTELHSNNKVKDWSVARRYYQRARQVMPSVGNAHNQLAVLTAYNGGPSVGVMELTSVYFYCRSVLVSHPFSTGTDNLKVVFDKNAKRVSRSSVHTPDISGFLTRFVYIHGALFTLAQHEAATISSCSNSCDEAQAGVATSTEYTNILSKTTSLVTSWMPALFEDFERLMPFNQSTDIGEILLRIISVCLFSIHFPSVEASRRMRGNNVRNSQGQAQDEETTNISTRSNAESLALVFLFSLINRISLCVCPIGSTGPRRSHIVSTLQMLSIFCDWGRGNLNFLHSISNHSYSVQGGEVATVALPKPENASPELIRSENRARSSMRVTLADMKTSLSNWNKKEDTSDHSSVEEVPPPLAEHIELRGYLPLARQYEVFFDSIPLPTLLSASPLQPEKDGQVLNRRLRNVSYFVDHSLVPPPSSKSHQAATPPSKASRPERGSLDRERNRKERKAKVKEEYKARRRESRREAKKHPRGDRESSSLRKMSHESTTLPSDKNPNAFSEFPVVSSLPGDKKSTNLYDAAMAAVSHQDGDKSWVSETVKQMPASAGDTGDRDSTSGDLHPSRRRRHSESESNASGLSTEEEDNESSSDCSARYTAQTAEKLEDDDDDADDIIVFKPAFAARPMRSVHNQNVPVVESVLAPESIVDRPDDITDSDPTPFLEALHKKNVDADGWISHGGNQATLGLGLNLGGLIGEGVGRTCSPENNALNGLGCVERQYDYWGTDIMCPQIEDGIFDLMNQDDTERDHSLATDVPPGFSAVPPGFNSRALADEDEFRWSVGNDGKNSSTW